MKGTARATEHGGSDVLGTAAELGLGEANENVARLVAYLGPYLFWGSVGCALTGVWLMG